MVAILLGWGALAAAHGAQPTVTPRPAALHGTAVVPEHFLRRWDPVTVFFARDTGPAGGGPEDHAERWVTLSPAHPGVFTWLDARTLQFRPAEPWPPLARFTWRVAGKSYQLATLMTAPTGSVPADGSEGLDPVSAITLSFPEPLPASALAQAVTLELRPLPGIGSAGAHWLGAQDFDVKVLERQRSSDPAFYELELHEPIPAGTRVVVHFRLSLSDSEGSFVEISFSTAEPFRAVAVGCQGGRYPLGPDGARYAADQAIRCEAATPTVLVDFSAAPRQLGALEGRNLVRLTPPVSDLEFRLQGRTLEVSGSFARGTPYQVTLVPTPISDRQGRPLEMRGESEVYLFFPTQPPYLRWGAAHGVVERRGPQMVPLAGRGDARVDVRIQRVDPLDLSFWPFPETPVTVEEAQRPPGPGEAPAPYTQPEAPPRSDVIAEHIAALGTAQVSRIFDLPLRRESGSATFGLDLGDTLAAAGGKGEPGTYLVGLRRLGKESKRQWMRLQVTDLSLTTVEEPTRVVFVVTSLATAEPVSGAAIKVEGAARFQGQATEWRTLWQGTSDATGRVAWDPAPPHNTRVEVRRLVVQKGEDLLVLDATAPPDVYHDNSWTESNSTWLQWTQEDLIARRPGEESRAHIFTDRPVYRPEDSVHVKGYLRQRYAGRLWPMTGKGTLVIEGPGDLVWRYPVILSQEGTFYHLFHEEKLATGVYSASFVPERTSAHLGKVSFRMEAYRLPRFEVRLDGPQRAGLDHELDVKLTATYYAGGRVASRPVAWRVTQFPYTWRPKARSGFFFSSDGRFSRTGRFESTAALERQGVTDDDGGAHLVVNPAIEPTAQPRTYVVEATVTGADDQTVSSTKRIVALPPFLLGLKVPRYLEKAQQVQAQVIAVGPDDDLVAGQQVTVRLLHRQWHSYLRASDFSDGVARYVTDVVDEKVEERQVVSGKEPVDVALPLPEAGVYVVEVESHDRLGRAQVVAVDLFAGGGQPVAWSKPSTAVFAVAAEKKSYRPGETANLVLESPFQEARALAVVEAPEGNRYKWLDVEGGKATFAVPIEGTEAPRLPVHFLLMRGRVSGTRPQPGNSTDLGKPATMAATAWIDVEPVDNRVEVSLSYPHQALPGKEIEVEVALSDPDGQPLPGEATLWLVDQAVLALGREQRLDPLPDFVTPIPSRIEARDTRSMVFGFLPFTPAPGGGSGEEPKSLFDHQTVRRNFQPVPFYAPAIQVGADGKARVKVKLSDDLTNFELRAKAVSGKERFGYATGHLEVRLPVIVQPALPRFVRPGDEFVASAVARLVEGQPGPGKAEARLSGLEAKASLEQPVSFLPNRPLRLDFPVSVPTPTYDAQGVLSRRQVEVKVAVERESDGAGDAFSVTLPIRDDRQPVAEQSIGELTGDQPLTLPAITADVRPGTLRRSVLVATLPVLVRMAGGLSVLLDYPYGCTEQRLSRSRAELAMRRFRDILHLEGSDQNLDRGVADTLSWIPLVTTDSGLVAYWPGRRGYVSLTAWALDFVSEAKAAGYPVDGKLEQGLVDTLRQALRSDYGRFIDGESWTERTMALAALAQAGHFDPAYGAELGRRGKLLDTEAAAEIVQAFATAQQTASPAVPPLLEQLDHGFATRLHQGQEIYAGLAGEAPVRNGLVLPSETRTVATAVRALADSGHRGARMQLLVDALVTLGRGDGWGNTNADAAALLALADVLRQSPPGPQRAVRVDLAQRHSTLRLGGETPTAYLALTDPSKVRLSLADAAAEAHLAVRATSSYLPAADGAHTAPRQAGFVVSRELLLQKTQPPTHSDLGEGGRQLALQVGEVVEDHVQVVNPTDRHYVAVVVPLAAGMEPLNPALATAPPEAKPSHAPTLAPSYVAFLDDQVDYFYDTLPSGTYDFYFRSRASVVGSFVQPAARAEMMYERSVAGGSAGARVVVSRAPEPQP